MLLAIARVAVVLTQRPGRFSRRVCPNGGPLPVWHSIFAVVYHFHWKFDDPPVLELAAERVFQKRWRIAKGCYNLECASDQVVGGPQITLWASGARAGIKRAWRRSPDHVNVADGCVVPRGYVTAVGGVCARVEVDGDDFPAQSGKGSADAARAAEELKDPWHLSFACDLLLGPIRALRQQRVLQLVLLDKLHEQRQCLAQASERLSRYVPRLSRP